MTYRDCKDVYLQLQAAAKEPVPGAKVLGVIADSAVYPPSVRQQEIAALCRRLNAEAFVCEAGDRTLIVVGHEIEDLYVVLACTAGLSPARVARDIRHRLASVLPACPPEDFVPAGVVLATLARWERQVGRVFGDRFAAGVVSAACNGRRPAEMTRADLEAVGRRVSSAICGCIELAES